MGYKVAVVGATGNVGREMLQTLAERKFPADEVVALASARSNGTCSRLLVRSNNSSTRATSSTGARRAEDTQNKTLVHKPDISRVQAAERLANCPVRAKFRGPPLG